MTYFTQKHQKAAKAVRDFLDRSHTWAARRIAELFPIGSLVFVECSERKFTMRVERHGRVWSDVLVVYGVNVETGKQRRFHAGFDRVLRVDLPKQSVPNKSAKPQLKSGTIGGGE